MAADSEAPVSGLAWSWVIEALASSPEVHLDVLNDLITGTPISPDILGKEAREMVALRCLEGLIDSVKDINGTVASPSRQSRFDLSECFEDVLQRVLQEISLLNQGVVHLELAEDVHLFIDSKKAYLQKCALEQLKDRIQDGRDPLSEPLKLSVGLQTQSQHARMTQVEGDDSGVPVSRNESSPLDEQSAGIREQKDSPHLEEGKNKQLEEPSRNSIFSKTKRTCSETELNAQEYSPTNEENDESPKKKKPKHDSAAENSNNTQERSVPRIEPENKLGNDMLHIEDEGYDLAHKEPMKHVENRINAEKQPYLPTNVGDRKDQSMNLQACVPTNDEQIQADQCRDGTDHVSEQETNNEEDGNVEDNVGNNELHVQLTQAAETSCERNDIYDIAEKRKDDSEKLIQPGTTLDHNNAHDRCEASSGVNKANFMTQLLNFSEDSLATEWNETNSCMKCNRNGNLLSCSVSSCPVAVHESCLGFSATFDNRGKFWCPICAYSHAVAEYEKAKKKTTLARQELSMFISGNTRVVKKNPLPEPCNVNVLRSETTNTNLKLPLDIPEREKESVVEERETEEESKGKQKGSQAEHHCDQGFYEDENAGGVGQTQAEKKFSRETRGCSLPNLSQDASAASTSEIEETSEDENNKPAYSKYSLRRLKRESRHVPSPAHIGRRTRIPWTAEEEEMLKEGMKRFGSGNSLNIPWRSILEFGSPVFSKRRSTINLKDKWRNMLKADPDLNKLLS